MRNGSLGGVGGGDGNEREDEKGCEVEAVAVGAAAVEPGVTGEWGGHVSVMNAKREAELN